MAEYGFNNQEREQYYKPERVYSSFGRDSGDYIVLEVFQNDELVLRDKFNPDVNTEGFLDLNVGQHLRDNGLSDGDYIVQYRFLRKLAGRDHKVMVNGNGELYAGQVITRNINGEIRYYTAPPPNASAQSLTDNPPIELFIRDLKYSLDKISGDRTEIVVKTQDFKNQTYHKNFREMNSIVKFEPFLTAGSGANGSIKFDENDPSVLVANLQDNDRGFTQNMVGGEIRLPRIFQKTITEEYLESVLTEVQVPVEVPADVSPPPPPPVYEDLPPEPDPPQDPPVNDEEDEDYGGQFDYDGVCFHPNTKVTLSNGRQVPIKMMKIGMKVRTDKGVARVKKVIKSDRGFGDLMVKYKNLIVTDHHPIRTKDGWFMSREIGKIYYQKPPFKVWNLVLDKDHTIFANNIVAATLGKWKTTETKHWQERFLEDRNRFRMEGGSGRFAYIDFATTGNTNLGEEGTDPITPGSGVPQGGLIDAGEEIPLYGASNNNIYQNEVVIPNINEEVILHAELPALEHFIQNTPVPEGTQDFTTEIVESWVTRFEDVTLHFDYVAKITEVLDYNKVRVSISYQEAADANGHDGPSGRDTDWYGWNVLYEKNNIERFKTYMVCDDDYYLITNENKNFFETQDSKRVFKLKQPLAGNKEELDKVYFVEKRLPSHVEVVRLVPFIDEDPDGLFLQLPNLNSIENPINFRSTRFETHNTLLGSDNQLNKDIERKLISGSLLDVQVNTEFNRTSVNLNLEPDDIGFGNFINYSSAERRLRNFKKKVEYIETYSETSSSLVSLTGSLSDIQSNEDKRARVINSFDPFEHYMYFQSSSYVSSSAGQYHENSWPKQNSSKPYVLYHSSGSEVTNWFDNIILSASTYDTINNDRLSNNLPMHVKDDTMNNAFIEFMDMTGQQFDEIWTYTKHFTDVNNLSPNVSEGISKDIASEFAKSLGLELTNGNDLLILPEYLEGKNPDGSTKYETPQEEVTEEIWKRLLNNIPFFIKAKGSVRCLKGILNCYGIPSSILRVREYGGPDNQERVSYEVKRKFTYALDFHSSQYVKSLWTTDLNSQYPQALELRFRTPNSVGSSGSMVIAQKENDWAIHLKDNGTTDDYGYLKFSVSASTGVYGITSSLLPFYNDEMWSVMLTRVSASGVQMTDDLITRNVKYELTTKQYDASREKVKYQTSSSLTTGIGHASSSAINAAFSGSVGSRFVYLGGQNTNFGSRYSGSLMEYRLWSEPLSQSVFDNHVRAPRAYNGNSYSSSYHDLLIRYPLDNNVNLASTSFVRSVSNRQNYFVTSQMDTTGSVNGFTSNTFRSLVDKEQLKVPNIGPSRRNATKVRIEDSTIIGNLSPDERKEKSSQDFAPIDSEKVGIYFSPVDVVNEDILYSIADFNFDDYIGDPRDQYKVNYRGLKRLQTEYFQKYSSPNNFFDYLRILTFYDPSVFTQLKNWVPARSKATTGVLIEPNILERSKQVIGDRPEFDNRYFENASEFEDGVPVTRFISGSKDDAYFDIGGEQKYYESGLNAVYHDNSGSLGGLGEPTLVKLGVIDPKTPHSYNYATASVTFGGEGITFGEVLQPVITGSRLAEHNQEKVFFYSSSLSASRGLHYSSSFVPSEHQSVYYDSRLFRSFIGGSVTRDDGQTSHPTSSKSPFIGSVTIGNAQLSEASNTFDGGEPVETTTTTPTQVITKEPGDSKLKVE
ncbi:MAG: hypothetical protein CMD43_03025 [Gammaproteobacteria bacterium]|nr:hypothetical protein [Gammaproteobacteria bacterium]